MWFAQPANLSPGSREVKRLLDLKIDPHRWPTQGLGGAPPHPSSHRPIYRGDFTFRPPKNRSVVHTHVSSGHIMNMFVASFSFLYLFSGCRDRIGLGWWLPWKFNLPAYFLFDLQSQGDPTSLLMYACKIIFMLLKLASLLGNCSPHGVNHHILGLSLGSWLSLRLDISVSQCVMLIIQWQNTSKGLHLLDEWGYM